ncbi:MAG TPA: M23 family metallopeptidase [Telluria sp.]|jgi:murein DD-endopeptidase MepM/ murein hydrolase activator NlpD
MPKSVRLIAVSIVLIGLLAFAWPWLGPAVYAARLNAMDAPAHLPIPVAGLTRRALTDTWQASRAPNRRHEGIDIFAKKGTAVLSSTEGVVVRTGQNPLGGNVVWVLGPAGHYHYYAHLDQFAGLQIGARVSVGTVLGTVGNTGNARTTPPHLHYGVYADQGAINPYPLLTAVPR